MSPPPRRAFACEPLERRTLFSAPGAAWPLVFHDEFDGGSIDRTKWTSHLAWGGDTGDSRHHSDAYASYITDDNVVVGDGTLKLTTKRERVTAGNGRTFDYTQGMIQTANQFRSRYGYFEIRARLPTDAGPGLWPAFWTLADGWPPEDDIGEWWTSNGRSHQGLAYGSSWQDMQWDDYNTYAGWYGGLPTGWHTWAMEWGPGYQKFLIDGRVRHTVSGSHVPDVPQYVILNSGVESASPPADWTIFPNAFEVDYVRVYGHSPSAGGSIVNSDFEADPQGTNWTTHGQAVVQGTNARTGGRAMRLIDAGATAEQRITGLRPDTTYTLNGYAFVTEPGSGDEARLGVKDYGGGDVSAATTAGTYSSAALTFTTGPSDTGATVYLAKPAGTGTAYFDDLHLSATAWIAPMPDQVMARGTTLTVPLQLRGEMPAGPASLTVTPDNATLLPDGSVTMTGDGSGRTVRITPTAKRRGKATITVTATDLFGGVDTQSFVVTVKKRVKRSNVGATLPTITVSDTPPAGATIAQPDTGTPATAPAGSAGGDDAANYVAFDRPAQGQTFTTPKKGGRFRIASITVKGAGGGSSFPEGATLAARIVSFATGDATAGAAVPITVLAAETAAVPAGLGNGFGGYLTLHLAASPTLRPNTTYGVDLAGGPARVYFPVDGAADDSYASGQAYSSGADGLGGRTLMLLGTDRTFFIRLDKV